jgi:hypothetical protein
MSEPVTIFTIPKAFAGHAGIIQANALRSWTAHGLRVILIGDDPGVREFAAEIGATHLPDVPRTECGTPLLDWAFQHADAMAQGRWVMFANSDILFPDDPAPMLARLGPREVLAVGQRTNAEITKPLDFRSDCWRAEARAAAQCGERYTVAAIDYFIFPRGSVLRELPAFGVGRPGWDNWYCDRALVLGLPLVDLTEALLAVHQNHDYSHIKGGNMQRVYGPEVERNRILAQGRYRTIRDATMRMTADGRLVWNHYAAARALWRLGSLSGRFRALAHVAHPASWAALKRRTTRRPSADRSSSTRLRGP